MGEFSHYRSPQYFWNPKSRWGTYNYTWDYSISSARDFLLRECLSTSSTEVSVTLGFWPAHQSTGIFRENSLYAITKNGEYPWVIRFLIGFLIFFKMHIAKVQIVLFYALKIFFMDKKVKQLAALTYLSSVTWYHLRQVAGWKAVVRIQKSMQWLAWSVVNLHVWFSLMSGPLSHGQSLLGSLSCTGPSLHNPKLPSVPGGGPIIIHFFS